MRWSQPSTRTAPSMPSWTSAPRPATTDPAPIQAQRFLTPAAAGISSLAAVVVRPVRDYNDIKFEAESPGTEFNGVTITFTDDGSILNGTATASYNTLTKTLTINVQSPFTDALAVINAVNNGPNKFSIPFLASNDGTSTGIGSILAFEESATSGGISDVAQATFAPAGNNNDLVFKAQAAGSQYRDVKFQFTDDGTITDGTATAVYDATDPFNKILTHQHSKRCYDCCGRHRRGQQRPQQRDHSISGTKRR